ncbi:hypothetical protein BH11BAC5_BH11BAC5_12510 [soil metagenome]
MAVQLATFLSGKMGPVVFYKRGGTYIARSVPDKVNQSVATKKWSRNFGIAAVAGKILRQQLGTGIPYPKDKRMQSRFAGAISKWLGTGEVAGLAPQTGLPYISGFSFNDATSIATAWKEAITVTKENEGLVQLHIPSFLPTAAIVAPANTTDVELSIVAASCDLLHSNIQGSSHKTIQVPYVNNPVAAQIIPMALPATNGCLLVLVAAINFIAANGEKNTRVDYIPCNVIDARYC